MKPRFLFFLVRYLLSAAGLSAAMASSSADQSTTLQSSREDAYRAEQHRRALLEHFNYKEAAAEFGGPSLALARVNLGIALYNLPTPMRSSRTKGRRDVLPASPQVHYVLGLIARSQNRTVEGIPNSSACSRSICRSRGEHQRWASSTCNSEYPEADRLFRVHLGVSLTTPPATYNLAMALLVSGDAGGQRYAEFQVLRSRVMPQRSGRTISSRAVTPEAIASTGADPGLSTRRSLT